MIATIRDYKNIFLHFLNSDTLEIYNVCDRYTIYEIENQITMCLLIAVLISKEYTFLPLGFPYETQMTRQTLIRLDCLRQEGLIRYAGKEQDLKTFLNKKKQGYNPFKNLNIYQNFFRKHPESIYKQISAPWISRHTSIGEYCVTRWDSSSVRMVTKEWKDLYDCLPDYESRNQFEEILRTFKDEYLLAPFIWPSVLQKLGKFDKAIKEKIRIIFEKYYYEAYLNEYDASILFDLPFETVNFNVDTERTPMTSYTLYFDFLKTLGLFSFIKSSVENPQQIIELKYNPNMIQLKAIFKNCVNEYRQNELTMAVSTTIQKEPGLSLKNQLISDLLQVNTSKTITTPSPEIRIRCEKAKTITVEQDEQMIEENIEKTKKSTLSERSKLFYLKHLYIYGYLGILLGFVCIVGGFLLCINGTTGSTSWTATFLGLESNINDATPGVVLFIVGVFILLVTRPKPKIRELK